ncbi:phage tail assembly protein T [Streptomyces sp. enrichment culture]|uniref:phage tail assembly protein T n=1 Tax=Streptomyces sp. enrichment culture TaxID=1795815 RepID=UPI003F577368
MLDRFSEEEMVRVVAYQNLYGPVTPVRMDVLMARLGMDVVAPHMKRGHKANLKDHLVMWDRRTRRQKTPQELLDTIRGIQKEFDRGDSR